MKLSRWACRHIGCGKRTAREAIAAGRIVVDGEMSTDGDRDISAFTRVIVDGAVVQDRQRICIAINKPAGVVSATKDPEHPTVIDLLPAELRHDLHLAGRLDKQTTGLVIVTNDGHFSEAITQPIEAVPKVYEVDLAADIDSRATDAFAAGIYLAYEDITTSPCEIKQISPRRVQLTIYEGAYHQVKRMFHAVGNRVIGLHRTCIGHVALGDLAVGDWRDLTAGERAPWLR